MRNISLLEYRGINSTLFTGRPQGKEVRGILKLNEIDLTDEKVTFLIPNGTTSFNPSFFLGLLFDSIKKLGVEMYEKKYIFKFEDENNESIVKVLTNNLNDGKRYAKNEIEDNNSFNQFYK